MSRPDKNIDWDIVEQCLKLKFTVKEISEKLHVGISTFYRRFMKKYGFRYHSLNVKSIGRPPSEIDWDVVEKCIEAGCSAQEISDKFYISLPGFYKKFEKKYGFGFSFLRKKNIVYPLLKKIRKLLQTKKSKTQIAKDLKISTQTLCYYIKRYDLINSEDNHGTSSPR